ncbi:SOS response-associated peptidase [Microbacterium sp. G2-8]|uniref:SOS response-associated peptidase n=1 Tax=Microbacterium sp. G2-8 TaxID=2842454 RepID=UPI001C89C47F|nr:SOS response-associated peptidase [Microbacterium sp. G2-8]
MCGRFALDDKVNADITEFVTATGRQAEEWSWDWEPRYNIKPTTQIPILVDAPKTRELRIEGARWGLVPPWSDSLKLKFPTFNARTEGITGKATWKGPLKSRRCIVPAAGYYEWTGEKGAKTPWWIHPDDGSLGFAGLYAWWQDKSVADDDPARWTLTATILTMPTVDELASIHDRNPVGLPQDLWEHWMDPETTGDQALVDEAVNASRGVMEQLEYHRVMPFKATDDGPQLLEPA